MDVARPPTARIVDGVLVVVAGLSPSVALFLAGTARWRPTPAFALAAAALAIGAVAVGTRPAPARLGSAAAAIVGAASAPWVALAVAMFLTASSTNQAGAAVAILGLVGVVAPVELALAVIGVAVGRWWRPPAEPEPRSPVDGGDVGLAVFVGFVLWVGCVVLVVLGGLVGLGESRMDVPVRVEGPPH